MAPTGIVSDTELADKYTRLFQKFVSLSIMKNYNRKCTTPKYCRSIELIHKRTRNPKKKLFHNSTFML
jgi:hypothetical protein